MIITTAEEYIQKILEETNDEYLRLDNKEEQKRLIKLLENSNNPILYNVLARFYEEGTYVKENIKKAIFWYTLSANLGNDFAMERLGYIYLINNEDELDKEKSIYWYQKAADLGNTEAMEYLALSYYDGSDVEQDYEKAFNYCSKLATEDNELAIYLLAQMYRYGEGVEVNEQEAIKWYEKTSLITASDMFYIGVSYQKGIIIDKDLNKTLEWLLKAAKYGDIEAMKHVGMMYINGDGVEQDKAKGTYWLERAEQYSKTKAKNKQLYI